MRTWRVLYLALCGALMSFGLAAAWGIGLPILLIGIFMTSYELARTGRRDLCAIIVGVGISQLILTYRITKTCVPPECQAFLDSTKAFVVCGAIVLAGIAWGVIETLRRRSDGAGT